MSDSTPHAVRTHPAALVSFLLGLSSVGLLALSGVPALVVGLRALRTVNASDGRLRGARLAVAGMALGGVGTLLTVVGLVAVIAHRLNAERPRVECANHLRMLGIATGKYADTHEAFPSATSGPHQLPPGQQRSWLAEVLPLIGEGTRGGVGFQQLARRIDRSKGWADPANRIVAGTTVVPFLCPGMAAVAPDHAPGLTTYVGCAGVGSEAEYLQRGHDLVRLYGPRVRPAWWGPWLPPNPPLAGMFGLGRGATRREVEPRGSSYVFLVLETASQNGPWLAGGSPTVRGLAPDLPHYSGPGRPFGGLHRDVINILYVDGSVRLLHDNTPGEVFRAHATLRPAPP